MGQEDFLESTVSELTINPVDVARLKVEPSEVLLIQVAGVVDQDTVKRIKEIFRTAFIESGCVVPGIVVIDDRIKVTVVRAADVEGH